MTTLGPPRGYRPSQKVLHWLTVGALGAQLAVGYNLDLDDCDPPGEDLSGGDTSDAFEDRMDRLEDACEARADDYDLIGGGVDLAEVHLFLGLLVLALGVVRPLWRRHVGLPPWSEHLSIADKRLVHWTERALLALLVVVPVSGLLLVGTGDDDWLPLHIGAHIAFFAALAAHLFTNARPKILRRML
ncbi:cytochrome b/b6 domain-containing protein [Nocardioides hwasunensis]|uniref:Cytochrome b/b6 domain-containing protein n=1 Tax=Nocardioides hwasunensis TaxID=397258 RepID=A0ABR8MFU6_9ACTN|nr:cytochrome b/b6 domain-containing protein [Nocardioides hwasunensis]MBD3913627.1 cytochrome b/b6 domain-containing protein [Nocardioides hwasunensis]